MQSSSSQHHTIDHLCVISLKRTPQRLQDFFRRNSQALENWKVHILEGVDGAHQEELFKKSQVFHNLRYSLLTSFRDFSDLLESDLC